MSVLLEDAVEDGLIENRWRPSFFSGDKRRQCVGKGVGINNKRASLVLK